MNKQLDRRVGSQADAGYYRNEGDVADDLIPESQMHEHETPEDVAAIRAALIAAEESIKQSEYSKKSADEIWEEAKGVNLVWRDFGSVFPGIPNHAAMASSRLSLAEFDG